MTFLIGLETPSRGSYTLGFIKADDGETLKKTRQSAQNKVVEALVAAGFPREKIGIQVTDNSSLEIGLHRVVIVPIKEFDSQTASALAALLR